MQPFEIETGEYDAESAYFFATAARAVYYGNADILSLVGQGAGGAVNYLQRINLAPIPAVHLWDFDDVLLLAIQGTSTNFQLLLQIAGSISTTNPAFPGRLNATFLAWTEILWPLLREAAFDVFPNHRILITGHSLGGAMALTIGYRCSQQYPSRFEGIYTFGCPRVGNEAFADACTFKHVRVANTLDAAAEIPPRISIGFSGIDPGSIGFSFYTVNAHSGMHVNLDDQGRGRIENGVTDTLVIVGRTIQDLFTGSQYPLASHAIKEYVRRTRLGFTLRARPNRVGVAFRELLDLANSQMDALG